jgi:phosphoglycolate phosphatase/putative hydrolase of the HAD superfamily
VSCVPIPAFTQLKAIVLDTDGTLYRQRPLRRAMLLRLCRAYATRPVRGLEIALVLRAYRQSQERLRHTTIIGDVAAAQIRLTCERTGAAPDFVAAAVNRWMEREPLDLLSRFVQPGLTDFLQSCKTRGLRLAILSDYPAEAKLKALGILERFDLILCAQSPTVNAFKPSPVGLLAIMKHLGTHASETLYVGDRVDVDVSAAAAAGVPCAILRQRDGRSTSTRFIPIRDYVTLQRLLSR